MEECSSGQGSEPPRNKAAQSKTRRQGTSQTNQNEENNSDAPDSVTTKVPKKKKQTSVPRKKAVRSQTAPTSHIRDFSFANRGPGEMINENIGNIHNSNISDVGNDHSENHIYGTRQKLTYA